MNVLLMIAVFVLNAQGVVPYEPLAVEDMKETKGLLQAAEVRMARYRKSHPPVHRLVIDEQTGARYPASDVTEDLGSPLVDRYCTFRVNFNEFAEIIGLESSGLWGGRPQKYVQVVGTLETFLEQQFALADVYRDQANERYVRTSRIERLEREIDETKEARKRLSRGGSEPSDELPAGQPVAVHEGQRKFTPRHVRVSEGPPPWPFRPVGIRIRPPQRRQRQPGGGGGASSATAQGPCGRTVVNPPVMTEGGGSGYRPEDEEVRRRAAEEDRLRNRERVARRQREESKRRLGDLDHSFRGEMEDARHELRLIMPHRWEPLSRMPKRFDAVVWVRQVEWDRAADLPTLIIHGVLLDSEQLGVFGN